MKQNSSKANGVKKNTTARKKVVDAQDHLDAQAQISTSDPQAYTLLVANKAYELFERRGYQHGFHMEDWFQAERLVKENLA
jgi:hypothetical protein